MRILAGGLDLGHAIAAVNDRRQKGAGLGIFRGQQDMQRFAHQVLARCESMHAGHRGIAFRESAGAVGKLDLLIDRKTGVDGRLKFEAPDALRAVGNEGAIPRFAAGGVGVPGHRKNALCSPGTQASQALRGDGGVGGVSPPDAN